ncbi:alpha/beta fold hydrolase [Promicromonospora citrea]|uniref:Alpha/beta hydrolase n=1 Tax=Promicromonospora citrea TaxID=43677 RepID=A0A8H9L3H7_9MICO|nr:alpha/beta hydrolase [Promicromonospora citrea]NNH53391.1 alpha/beta hydrolase [Promicromonospora citrea]GGM13664.1 alpha/beta hydrolase [Promicromonospora citrea]HEV6955684.1 alpha/beta hydrolase [Promicromonospora sp.]
MNTTATKQTVVLVHGAYADSSSWNGSISALQEAGHRVVAVANPLRDLEGDAQYLRDVLATIEGPVVLAGHSYGGHVMSHAAEGNPDVTALVYVASFLAEPGESLVDLVEKFPGARLGGAAQPSPYTTPDGTTATELTIDPAQFHELFAADVDTTTAAHMAATQRPLALSAFQAPASTAAWRSIPSWVLSATKDEAIPADLSRFMAERADAKLVEVDASHAVTVSRPDVVTATILEAAQATTR